MSLRTLATLLSGLLAAPLAAQSCFVGEFGTSLGYGTTDTVYPIRPIGFAFPLNGTTYTDIHVNDHGFVELSNAGVPTPLGSGTGALYTPTTANFTAGAPKIAPLYSDMQLAGGGECFLNATPTQCTVTWHNAQSYGIPSPRFSFQLVLEPNGTIRFVYGPGCTNNSTYFGVSTNGIAGVTPAGGVAAPAGVDLSTSGVSASPTTFELFPVANGFDLASRTIVLTPTATGYRYATALSTNCATATRYGAGCDSLGLGSIGLPTLGNAGFRLRAESVPAISPVGLFAFSTTVTNPGLPLGPLLGMTGCASYCPGDIGIFTGSLVSTGPSGLGGVSTFDLPIANSATLNGLVLSTQALSFTLANPFGLATSNGLELRFGVSGPAGPPTLRANLVAIAPGTFTMGSTAGNADEQPVRTVSLPWPFWIGRHEVTQADYQAVMGTNPSAFASAPNAAQRPVENVSWNDAMAYCAALTAQERAAGRVPPGYLYRLPTEAEWEYCCRAGTTTPWSTGAGIGTFQANYAGVLADASNPYGQTAAVGSYAPNAFGLHDMHGNVGEWCLDAYGPYTPGATSAPYNSNGQFRTFRGGSWFLFQTASQCRSAARSSFAPGFRSSNYGFRVVLAPVAANVNPSLTMVPIVPGTFQMGSMAGASNEQPVRQVTLSRPFWMAKYEVTQAQYQALISSPGLPSQLPVTMVNYWQAIAYCNALNAAEQAAGRLPSGYQYRLPTEAEWEYCCRAGTTTEWNTGTSLTTSQANFGGALAAPSAVGSYGPNAFGLHDMHGNVSEWCIDTLAAYTPGPVTDPLVGGNAGYGASHVLRGGNFDVGWPASLCRSARRMAMSENYGASWSGFRIVLAPLAVDVNPTLNMVAITPGTFLMGSMAGNPDEQPVRQVGMTTTFWMSKYEVTQEQYQARMSGNPSYFQGPNASNAAQRPVEQVSWNDAVAYCQSLTTAERTYGRVPWGYEYRLPTEAEWEYCCRAGTTTEWNTGASLSTGQANFQGVLANGAYTAGQTAVVGSYAANAFGLHDMHGNVWEWCLDSYAPYVPGAVTNPFVTGGAFRVLHGGCYFIGNSSWFCRSARRGVGLSTYSDSSTGFRVVLAPILVP